MLIIKHIDLKYSHRTLPYVSTLFSFRIFLLELKKKHSIKFLAKGTSRDSKGKFRLLREVRNIVAYEQRYHESLVTLVVSLKVIKCNLKHIQR